MFSVYIILYFYYFDFSYTQTVKARTSEVNKNTEKVSYSGAQVWQSHLRNITDVNFIRGLECNDDIQIWNVEPYKAQYLVKRKNMNKVKECLKKNHLNYTVHIADVHQKLCNMILDPETDDVHKKGSISFGEDYPVIKKLSWKRYPSWDTIRGYLAHIAEDYGEYAKLRSIGNSSENRPLLFLKISNNEPTNKPILIISGVHSHEWVAIITTLFVIDSIASNFKELPDYLQNKDWYFIPVLNPDGYVYSYKVDRFWKKNRRCCKNLIGVDLALNFGNYFGEEDVRFASDQCTPNYEGPHAFSEPETKALRDFLTQGCKRNPIRAFLDIQSYGQLIQFPWNAIEIKTNDSRKHAKVAQAMRQMIYDSTKSTYHFTTGFDSPYPRFGVSTDWAYALDIVYSYVIKTGDTGTHGHLLPNKLLKDTAGEVFTAIQYLAQVVDKDKSQKTERR